ncbi:maleylacetoacetate isomerase [Saccharospirillum salsuginis]|uniref:Maleylacetoacetate isomerase n=1 Tax=Saccharospirillum salsuginis TaxID=418750 RepID=A0A918KII2_9GAMM|nr:maleylacetoacetate isomerase [Saccharospirillum salsuginis]GGX64654.1 putative maleylacetoacetate isomerase [Saccharospirillum salsuginis]
MKLYDYWRSSAAYRVRIALNLKQLDVEQIPVDLRTGEQQGDYKSINPSGLIPALDLQPGILHQSLAIIEYLDERVAQPRLLPSEPLERARVRALSQDIASDIHPVNNLRVLNRLREQFQASEQQILEWYRHWIETGFRALESEARRYGSDDWFFRNRLSLVDVVLVPQVYNAYRFDVDMSRYPRLRHIYHSANTLEAFAKAAPEQQAQP